MAAVDMGFFLQKKAHINGKYGHQTVHVTPRLHHEMDVRICLNIIQIRPNL